MNISEASFARRRAKEEQIFAISVQNLLLARIAYIIFEEKRNIVADEKWICQKIIQS